MTWAKPAREKNKISVGNLSSAGSGRSSSIGSRPSSRKTSEISLPCVSPRSSVYKPPHSSPPRCEQMKQRRFSTTSGPFSPVKQQQFHLPPLAMQSLNFMQHPGSKYYFKAFLFCAIFVIFFFTFDLAFYRCHHLHRFNCVTENLGHRTSLFLLSLLCSSRLLISM